MPLIWVKPTLPCFGVLSWRPPFHLLLFTPTRYDDPIDQTDGISHLTRSLTCQAVVFPISSYSTPHPHGPLSPETTTPIASLVIDHESSRTAKHRLLFFQKVTNPQSTSLFLCWCRLTPPPHPVSKSNLSFIGTFFSTCPCDLGFSNGIGLCRGFMSKFDTVLPPFLMSLFTSKV